MDRDAGDAEQRGTMVYEQMSMNDEQRMLNSACRGPGSKRRARALGACAGNCSHPRFRLTCIAAGATAGPSVGFVKVSCLAI